MTAHPAARQSRSALIERAEDRDWARLPESLQVLRGVLGPHEILRLAEGLGGRDLYIPSRLDSGHPLARVLGIRAARRLAGQHGGTRLYVSRQRPVLARLREQAIRHEHRAGKSVMDLVEQHRVSLHRVARIVSS